MMRTTYALAVLLLAMFLTCGAPMANAAAVLELSDGVSTVTIADNGAATCAGTCTGFVAGVDGSGIVGVVSWLGAFDQYSVNVTTGISKPTLGSASSPSMDLNTVNVKTTSATANTLTIKFSDTGFTGSSLTFALEGAGTLSAGSGSFAAYYDSTDTALALTNLIGSAPFNFVAGTAFTAVTSGLGPVAPPNYSLTEVLTVNFPTGGAAFSGDFALTGGEVPEPATVGLLGGVLLVTFGAIRRKLHRNV